MNKNGHYVSHISQEMADMSVKSDKSKWINPRTIQIMYHKEDEREMKLQAWERDNYTCYLCGDVMHKGHPELTIDHVHPKRLGGSILLKNIRTCCRFCNGQKGHRTLSYYYDILIQRSLFMILWFNEQGRGMSIGKAVEENKEKH